LAGIDSEGLPLRPSSMRSVILIGPCASGPRFGSIVTIREDRLAISELIGLVRTGEAHCARQSFLPARPSPYSGDEAAGCSNKSCSQTDNLRDNLASSQYRPRPWSAASTLSLDGQLCLARAVIRLAGWPHKAAAIVGWTQSLTKAWSRRRRLTSARPWPSAWVAERLAGCGKIIAEGRTAES
jgi:hypothetical protein